MDGVNYHNKYTKILTNLNIKQIIKFKMYTKTKIDSMKNILYYFIKYKFEQQQIHEVFSNLNEKGLNK